MKALGKMKTPSHSGTLLSIGTMYNDYIDDAHRKYPNVSKKMITALIKMESLGKASIVSPKGAIGLMQLMPETAKDLKVNPWNAGENIRGGTHYMSDLLNKYNGDVDKSLAAYNWGMGNVDRKGLSHLPSETQNYVNKYHRLVGE